MVILTIFALAVALLLAAGTAALLLILLRETRRSLEVFMLSMLEERKAQREERDQYNQRIERLTESLARSEGKIFVPQRRTLEPAGPGHFDVKPLPPVPKVR